MTKPLSLDLRERLISAVEDGISRGALRRNASGSGQTCIELIANALSKLSSSKGKSTTEPCRRSTRPLCMAAVFRARACSTISGDGSPRMKVSETKGLTRISPDHPEPDIGQALLMDALGTTDLDFLDGLLRQLANAGSQGQSVDESGLNFMLSIVEGVEPRDQVEAMLAAQMAAVHMATMTFARRLAHVETPCIEEQVKKVARPRNH